MLSLNVTLGLGLNSSFSSLLKPKNVKIIAAEHSIRQDKIWDHDVESISNHALFSQFAGEMNWSCSFRRRLKQAAYSSTNTSIAPRTRDRDPDFALFGDRQRGGVAGFAPPMLSGRHIREKRVSSPTQTPCKFTKCAITH